MKKQNMTFILDTFTTRTVGSERFFPHGKSVLIQTQQPEKQLRISSMKEFGLNLFLGTFIFSKQDFFK